LIFFFSCKKEKKDTTSPLVSITSPADQQAFNMFDTLTVVARVSDETQLTSIIIALIDMNNIVVQSSLSVPIQSKDFTFSVKYALNEYHLPSAFYYLSITVSDGSNSHQSTRKIYVTESPTLKTGYYVCGVTQSKNVYVYDAAFALKNTIVLNTGFKGVTYGGYYHQAYVAGNSNQPFQAFDVTYNDQLVWTAAAYVSDPFTCTYSDGVKPYIGYFSGNMLSFNSNGGQSTTYVNNNSNYYPVLFSAHSKYAAGIFKDKTGGGNIIIGFFRNSGVATNSTSVPLSVIGIFEKAQDELYVIGNDATNNAVLYTYNVPGNYFNGPFSLGAGKMLSAVQFDSDYLVYSSANGNIYGYRYSNGNNLVLASVTAQKIIYKSKLNELSAASRNQLFTYSLSGNYSLIQSNLQAFTDSIIGFEVITNK